MIPGDASASNTSSRPLWNKHRADFKDVLAEEAVDEFGNLRKQTARRQKKRKRAKKRNPDSDVDDDDFSGSGISSEDDSDDSDKDIQIDNAEVCRISYIYCSDG